VSIDIGPGRKDVVIVAWDADTDDANNEFGEIAGSIPIVTIEEIGCIGIVGGPGGFIEDGEHGAGFEVLKGVIKDFILIGGKKEGDAGACACIFSTDKVGGNEVVGSCFEGDAVGAIGNMVVADGVHI
jgi:hypothetical protein